METIHTPAPAAPPLTITVASKAAAAALALALVLGGLCLALLPPDQRFIAFPVLALAATFIFFVLEIWSRDKAFPFLELGVFAAASTTLYSIAPLLQHLVAGMEWTILSDMRLAQYAPSPEEFGGFAWRHVTYLVSLAAAYLWVRGKRSAPRIPLRMPDRATSYAIVFWFALATLWPFFLRLLTGVDVSTRYDDLAGSSAALASLPQALQQMTARLAGFILVLKIFLALLLFSRYQQPAWRIALFLWIGLECLVLLSGMGARTPFLQSLLILLVLYHRMVRPLKIAVVVPVCAALLLGIIAYGYARDLRNVDPDLVKELNIASAGNEFFTLYANGYDIFRRKEEGALSPAPWNLYISDLTMLVPQQLLPIQKEDPSSWYLRELGLEDSGIGLMWGVVAQAGIGLGYLELILRGAALGALFALFHRWYARHASNWILTALYVYLCLQSYTTFRGTTFSFFMSIEYSFLGLLLLIYLTSPFLRGARSLRPAPGAAG